MGFGVGLPGRIDGSDVGDFDGAVGAKLGSVVGHALGADELGLSVGPLDGAEVEGAGVDGRLEGMDEGNPVGSSVGHGE